MYGTKEQVPIYSAYGLTIDSELPLPELQQAESAPVDVRIRFGEVNFASDDSRVLYKAVSPGEVIVFYAGVGGAIVQPNNIVLKNAKKADSVALRLFVLQQVLGVLLLERGYFVLHASTAVVNGKAVAFAGVSGEGKSTLVAALNEMGCPVLTDDVLAIRTDGDALFAEPGLVQLKLTAESRAAVGATVLAQQSIGVRAKALCAVRGASLSTGVPLGAIYLLESGSRLEFTPVPPSKAAIELVRHTYGSKLLPAIGASQRHFEQCVKIARAVSITLLTRPRDLALVKRVAEKITTQIL